MEKLLKENDKQFGTFSVYVGKENRHILIEFKEFCRENHLLIHQTIFDALQEYLDSFRGEDNGR